ncbi:zf-CCHC domain-containing protein, partial [Cephalotus follicularis]
GRNTRVGGCTHCGRADHQQRNCRKWNGWCLKCGASNHLRRDCPERQGTIPAGPMSNNDAADGSSYKRNTGKSIMRGKAFILAFKRLPLLLEVHYIDTNCKWLVDVKL